jgi:hypothetical protein
MNYELHVDYFEIPSEFNARGRPRPRANRVSSKFSVDGGAQSCVGAQAIAKVNCQHVLRQSTELPAALPQDVAIAKVNGRCLPAAAGAATAVVRLAGRSFYLRGGRSGMSWPAGPLPARWLRSFPVDCVRRMSVVGWPLVRGFRSTRTGRVQTSTE